ncbi:MAG: sel1 repeat family protein [Muribaculaceae bacterium]|nr:sel1 repeat family protein [Muribaculaceae bacterium]
MKTFKRLFGIVTLIAIIATVAAPQAQAKKKRDTKKAAIEELISQGNKCYQEENFEQAFQYFEEAHKKGDIRGTHNLAVCYAEGKGVAQDYKKALKLYEKAAKKGDIDSQETLGEMYKNGYGCKRDFKKAIKWFEKAAKQGDSDSMYLIASCYYYGGYGIKRDMKKAREWMQKSADLGNKTAIDNLSKLEE